MTGSPIASGMTPVAQHKKPQSVIPAKAGIQKYWTMNTYKLIIAYDGTDYLGWQEQAEGATIVGTLNKAFKTVFRHECTISGASRTDAGVHALGQVARLQTMLPLPAERLQEALNNCLPGDIVIRSATLAAADYNPLDNVLEKTYHYHVFTERPLPMAQRYGWYYDYPLDIDKLSDCLQVFVGTHDFRSFCTGYDMKSTIRTINSISVSWNGSLGAYRITVRGPGFLRYMIRRIVGAGIEVASRKNYSANTLKQALMRKDPHQLLPCAPAKGLTLHEIAYHL